MILSVLEVLCVFARNPFRGLVSRRLAKTRKDAKKISKDAAENQLSYVDH